MTQWLVYMCGVATGCLANASAWGTWRPSWEAALVHAPALGVLVVAMAHILQYAGWRATRVTTTTLRRSPFGSPVPFAYFASGVLVAIGIGAGARAVVVDDIPLSIGVFVLNQGIAAAGLLELVYRIPRLVRR